MKFIAAAAFAALVLGGCTHAAISTIPMEIPGIGTVYKYQGRANFSHQIAEADQRMIEQCKTVNGGKPVVVNQQMRDLGVVTMSNSQALTNLNASAYTSGQSATLQGSANTSTVGSGTALRNMNQEILFKCVAQ